LFTESAQYGFESLQVGHRHATRDDNAYCSSVSAVMAAQAATVARIPRRSIAAAWHPGSLPDMGTEGARRRHVERLAILRSTSKRASGAAGGTFMRSSDRLASAIRMKSHDGLSGMRRDIETNCDPCSERALGFFRIDSNRVGEARYQVLTCCLNPGRA
jgi:hypothetical protein